MPIRSILSPRSILLPPLPWSNTYMNYITMVSVPTSIYQCCNVQLDTGLQVLTDICVNGSVTPV